MEHMISQFSSSESE